MNYSRREGIDTKSIESSQVDRIESSRSKRIDGFIDKIEERMKMIGIEESGEIELGQERGYASPHLTPRPPLPSNPV